MKASTMRRAYVHEATVTLLLARLAARLLPAARIFAWADRPPRSMRRFAGDEIGWVLWAVDTVATRPWMKTPCLPRALAEHAMLRRRGIASRLCLGVARTHGELIAHAWVEVGPEKVVGSADPVTFTRLASFGASR